MRSTKPKAKETKYSYSDDYLEEILSDVKTIAMVGASPNWNRPSYFAMKYLQTKGYKVFPINPIVANQKILGETVYASLSELPEKVDMVDIFRKSEDAGEITEQAIAHGAKVIWMQLGVINTKAAKRAEAKGIKVIMDRCPKIEFSRLFGELSWHGFNSKVISSKRRTIGSPRTSVTTGETKAGGNNTGEAGFETRAIHSGAAPDPVTGARSTPIFQTTAYVFDDADHAASLFNLQTFGNIYSRLSNPTTAVLEERIAALEKGKGTTCTASGHSAQLLALLPVMDPGSTLIASTRLYGGSITQFGKTFKKFNWNCKFVDFDDIDAVDKAARQPSVRAIFAESLANPGGVITDIEKLKQVTNRIGVPLIIDNTMATPYLCQPIEYGADIVVHSTTKFLSGHGNAMGGAIVDSGSFNWAQNDKFPSLAAPEEAYHGLNFFESFGDLAYTTYGHAVGLRDLGPTMAPMNAYLTLMGIETLALRMQRHVENAEAVANFLDTHEAVSWVSYAGLPASRYHNLAKKYLSKGAGSVFTFGIKGGYEAGVKFVEKCQLLSHLANIGDTRSLVLHPASTTHRQLTESQREAAGAGEDVIRLSIGLETADDIIVDIDQALA
ncbi:MAG: O-acetylhomoserine/O-acetylserine sulfhydrylase [Rhodospirillaceae bacterium]|nr:O-acetylhomoserine/O-acetylserine sulfhydrylase [Rhodospirillaceae bacterium]|tara:strand:- start:2949 stop:4781 length:1833 start_codon:yes stop_codon:yes gene_type:complete